MVALQERPGFWILAAMKSTEYFIRVVPLVACGDDSTWWLPVPWRSLQHMLGCMGGCLCLLTEVFRAGGTSVLMHTRVTWASKH